MIGLALVVSVALLGIAGGHFAEALWFAARRRREANPTGGPWPRAAILMTLRGADPGLAATLRSLLAQDYPQYHVYIALDRPDDPARNAVDEAMPGAAGRMTVSIREPDTARCTLACAALSQVLGSLDDSYSVAVITGRHRSRLCELGFASVLTDPPVVSAILLHLELPHRPPPIAPERGPPQADFLFDQTPAFDQSLLPGLDD